MTDQGFGLAEIKTEGDWFFTGDLFLPTTEYIPGMFFVLSEDGRPLLISRGGKQMFVMHPNQYVADNIYRPKWKKMINKLFGRIIV